MEAELATATERRRVVVRRVLQKPAVAGGHGVLVMCDVTDPAKVARHDREGCSARDR